MDSGDKWTVEKLTNNQTGYWVNWNDSGRNELSSGQGLFLFFSLSG